LQAPHLHQLYQTDFDLIARMREVEAARARNMATIPTTLGVEKKTNPFLRPDSTAIRRALNLADAEDVAVFAEMRKRKDSF
jgi:hydroxyacylglutathione hydrolase